MIKKRHDGSDEYIDEGRQENNISWEGRGNGWRSWIELDAFMSGREGIEPAAAVAGHCRPIVNYNAMRAAYRFKNRKVSSKQPTRVELQLQ